MNAVFRYYRAANGRPEPKPWGKVAVFLAEVVGPLLAAVALVLYLCFVQFKG